MADFRLKTISNLNSWSPSGNLACRWDDQDHSRAEDCCVVVVALERGDRGAVGVSDRVERFARADFVVNEGLVVDCGLRSQALDFGGFAGRRLGAGGFGLGTLLAAAG